MPGEVALGDEPGQRLLLEAAHRAGIEPVLFPPGGQQMLRQHHVGDADAGREAAGAGGKVHHRAVGPGHALQAWQRAGVKAELGVVVVLYNVPLPRFAGRPVQQFGPAACRHGDAGGELMAGRDVAHRRIRAVQCRHRKAVAVHRHTAAGHAVVFQHLLCAGVARRLHCCRAGQQRGQQAQQVFQTRTHHDLVRPALHAAILGKIIGQCLPQSRVALGIAVGEQLGRGIQQLLLQPRPGAEREQPRVHAPGGKVVSHRRRGRLGLRLSGQRRGFRCGRLRQGQIFLYIKAAALPRFQIPFRRQHLVGGIHRVHRDGQLRRQPPLAGHPGARRQRAAAHLPGQAAIELLVQWHAGVCIQCRGQMDHKTFLLSGHSAKLTP